MLITLTFMLFLCAFAAIGFASARVSTNTADDYLLAGRSVPPWLVGLSAVATNCSGYMFIGQIGLTYRIGLGSVWLAVGWMLGDAVAWWRFYGSIRRLSESVGARSIPGLLGARGTLTHVTSILVLVFLGSYAAAQLEAGDKALSVVLGTTHGQGAWLGAGAVLFYCYSGGLRASIWTDAAQSFVMIASMTVLLGCAVHALGGPAGAFERLRAIDPSLVSPWSGAGDLGFAPWALGWVGAGLGVLGQPTIVVRAMAIRSPRALTSAAATYFGWFVPFYAATIALGMCARALLPELADPELAMPTLALQLLPDVLVGLMLAGIFAATMSTADSQVLACSAALAEDLFPALGRRTGGHKLATVAVVAAALGVALTATSGVFALVLYAWAALGVTLGPLVALRAAGREVSARTGLAMCAAGLGAMFAWRAAGLASSMYEIVPGGLAAVGVYGLATVMRRG